MLFSCQVFPSSLVQFAGLGADDQAEADYRSFHFLYNYLGLPL
jgi:hypothetical protein